MDAGPRRMPALIAVRGADEWHALALNAGLHERSELAIFFVFWACNRPFSGAGEVTEPGPETFISSSAKRIHA